MRRELGEGRGGGQLLMLITGISHVRFSASNVLPEKKTEIAKLGLEG